MLSRIVGVALAGMAVAACASNPLAPSASQQGTQQLGGPPAAAPDSQANFDPPVNPPAARTVSPAVASAAIGGMFGPLGAAMDDEDKQRAYAAQIQALESGGPGAPIAWRNPDSGHYGSIVPGPTFDRSGTKCRQYTHTIYIDGKPQTSRGAACRNANGRWTPAG